MSKEGVILYYQLPSRSSANELITIQRTFVRSDKQVPIFSLENVICPMLLQLLVELQADAHIYFGLVFFGIGYPTETNIKVTEKKCLNIYL